ncbi:MAG: TIR domain-containing protein [Thermoanaerobacteraceae bacterium]|nr:TIR domain-containing protein [Thermoanaerobacteraceae bacterium]
MEKIPKVFISYSWTTPQHEEWVIDLATRLCNHGVDVVIDKWSLKEGQDKYAFMEQMVVDEGIDRVLIICDKGYMDKANARKGGVGDETAIISSEVYNKAHQEKFIPIIAEKDSDGKPYLPVFIKSRIYIDLSDDTCYEREYEKLLRNIYNRPSFQKPSIGKPPEWLFDEKMQHYKTRDTIRQLKDAQYRNPSRINGLISHYTEAFCEELEQYRLNDEILKDKNIDDVIIENIENLKTMRDNYIEFLDIVTQNLSSVGDKIASFFEQVYNYSFENKKQVYNELEFDHFRFLIWEMFLFSIVYFLRNEKYDEIKEMVNRTYFLKGDHYNTESYSFIQFNPYIRSIDEIRNKRLNLRKYSLAADILISRERLPIFNKSSIVEADVVLCQLSYIWGQAEDKGWGFWWFPRTYVYSREGRVGIWKKLVSRRFCEKIKILLNAKNIDEIREVAKNNDFGHQMRFNSSFEYAPSICGVIRPEDIGSKP